MNLSSDSRLSAPRTLDDMDAQELRAEVRRLRQRLADAEDRAPREDTIAAPGDVPSGKATESIQRNLLASSPMGIHEYELQGDDRLVFVAANPAADRLLGVANAQFIGLTIEQAFPPLAETEIPERYRRVARHGTPWRTEQLDYDDEQIRGAFEVHAFQTASGRMAALFLDISERKRSEEALRKQEQRFRLLAENSLDVIWTMSLDGQLTYVSPAVEQLAGWTPQEALELTLDQYLTAQTFEDATRILSAELTKPPEERLPQVRLAARQRTKDGGELDIEVLASWILNADGTPVGVQGTTRDLTARTEAEREQRRLIALIESSQEFIGLSTLAGEVLFLNESGQRLVGLDSVEEATHKRIEDFVAPDTRAWLREEVLPRVFAEGAARGEGSLCHLDTGAQIPIEFHTFQILGEQDGPPTHLGVVIRDISARRRAEQERQALQEQLQHSQKLEAVGRLAGGVAHDFNNLLTGILGCAELMDMNLTDTDPHRAEVREIMKATRRGADLVQQLLTFSRQQVDSPRVIQPNDTIRDSQRMLQRILGEHIDLRFTPDPELWTVKADPGQLNQVLVNLVANAHDAMPAGGTLHIATSNLRTEEPDDQAGDFVQLSVRDEGEGMADDIQARIFEPFFTTKPVGKGTGLGLSTAYGIVEQSGGAIAVDSTPGTGTTLQIRLPRTTAPHEPHAQNDNRRMPVGHETILLVEDDAPVRRIMARALRMVGYQVLEAQDGEEALQVYGEASAQLDLVLTDMVMPRVGGRQLYDALRGKSPAVKIIFMSGYTREATVADLRLGPEDTFLRKPFSMRQLTQTVRDVLNR